ncbi:MAG: hypothetical protein NT175_09745 [Bacteroidetes bacterium]|nr:hypothetical protein [Bacteroidota bacterium]
MENSEIQLTPFDISSFERIYQKSRNEFFNNIFSAFLAKPLTDKTEHLLYIVQKKLSGNLMEEDEQKTFIEWEKDSELDFISVNITYYEKEINRLEDKQMEMLMDGFPDAKTMQELESNLKNHELYKRKFLEVKNGDFYGQNNEIENPTNKPTKYEKIIWKGTPSVFGYLFHELIAKGFIEPPLHNGEINYTKCARLCLKYFDIKTTEGTLINMINPEKCNLSETKKAKFTIPEINDLS